MKKTIPPGNKARCFIALLICWSAMMLSNSAFAQSISIPTTYTTISKSDTVFSISTTNTDSWYRFTSTNSVAEVDIYNSTSPGFDSASIWVQSGSVITYIQSAVRVTDQYIILASGLSSTNIYWVDFHKTGASTVSASIHTQFRSMELQEKSGQFNRIRPHLLNC